jgi:hypothetical protein
MKIQRDRFYLYVGYGKSETKWTWEWTLTKPSYLWLLAGIGIFWRKIGISIRAGKRSEITRRHFSGDSSDFSTPRSYKPVKFDSETWTEWEL